ncbi:hypothetical protein SAMN05443287_103202 [Micromonospora phaseoli]|uniref:Uncharacterized protein n=1 Tax=Micromonospora phaseoli TaxID=1144548 RepID=A0A1H6WX19_9ACTN|nr:hypothetical protein [Micromonospora phaseoli]PZW01834.1 hypothetical protein CLV64_102201 [Micromonospora phaseoli]GIJ78218.1 hypothetical protein Xph01_26500 [Micromonospora phaseoli]SEJ16895.1 hypothetical protein SAMN05443287_103202 [Micromonospora phaseoli]
MIIEACFNGPPGSGNGGWSAGVFATAYGGPGLLEVTLRRPPPLDTPLALVDGEVRDPAGEVVARLRPAAEFDDDPVPPVDLSTARAASAAYPGLVDHPFPGCYVCGPDRADGLRIFPGRLPDGRTAASVRVPQQVDAAMVWAVLDCPGGWAVIDAGRPYVLGRIAARIEALPRPGDECVVTGAVMAVEGRKAQVATSLYAPDDALLGRARATWIAV